MGRTMRFESTILTGLMKGDRGEIPNKRTPVLVTKYGLHVIGAILILIAGRMASGMGRPIVKRLLIKAKTDESIVSFGSSNRYFKNTGSGFCIFIGMGGAALCPGL